MGIPMSEVTLDSVRLTIVIHHHRSEIYISGRGMQLGGLGGCTAGKPGVLWPGEKHMDCPVGSGDLPGSAEEERTQVRESRSWWLVVLRASLTLEKREGFLCCSFQQSLVT